LYNSRCGGVVAGSGSGSGSDGGGGGGGGGGEVVSPALFITTARDNGGSVWTEAVRIHTLSHMDVCVLMFVMSVIFVIFFVSFLSFLFPLLSFLSRNSCIY
jgi:hypothetical protein